MKPLSIEQSNQLNQVAKQFQLSLLYVFGSCARGDMYADSDIDIAYAADKSLSAPQLMLLQQKLQTTLSVNQCSIDLVNIASAPPLLRRLIIEEGQLLYGSAEADDQFYRHTIKSYIDSAPLMLATQRYVHEQLAI